ncbi:hypothetical protein [Burkholderia gladioli]|uniref:hypothetical protein n=1 Tax=Burkholderia gladioli TaxID=28095 RepID=UPI00163E0FA7|nr:hypothetical protein [Burkholderia gladioli]
MTDDSHDSAEQADPAHHPRRETGHDVTVGPDGRVEQKGHGSMDPTMIPQKPKPGRGPYEPPPGHLDDPRTVEPRGTDDPAA